jgi:hypothetical protein
MQPWTGLTPADREIIKSGVEMEIFTDPDPIDGFPDATPNGTIPFQFPPRLTSDGKEAIWEDTDMLSWEPLAMWMGSHPRKITLETQYVITSKSGDWNVTNIAGVLNAYKSYFYRSAGQVSPTNMPLVRLKIYQYAPDTIIKWRARNVTITPDGGLINQGGSILPVIHKVSMSLELITQVQGESGKGAFHKMPALPPRPKKTWY